MKLFGRFELGKKGGVKPKRASFQAKTNLLLFLLALVLSLLTAFLIFAFWKQLPPEIPLYYSQPWGEARLGTLNSFYLLPFVSLATLALNLLASRTLFKKNQFALDTLGLGTFLVSLLLFITTLKIILIVL